MANPKKKIDALTEFERTCLIAAWRYFQYRETITSSCFPGDIIKRYWTSGEYADSVLFDIAHQFAEIDHGELGEEDWDRFSDAHDWCIFFRFCEAWVNHFTPMKMNGTIINAFWCDRTKRWYDRDTYIRSGGSIFQFINEEWIAKEAH